MGESGAGKTVLAIELVLQLLEPVLAAGGRLDQGQLVPVRLSAARWTLGRPFETWLAEQLAQDFGLAARDAHRLVRDRRVLPVVDGLDELDPEPATGPPRRAIGLLAELNRYSDLSGRRPGAVVVTCRADRHAELSAARAGLDDAALIHLHDLTGRQISAYLRARWPDGHPSARTARPIHAALSGPSGKAVHAALATPWRLVLTVTAVESGADPAELLRADPGPRPGAAAARIVAGCSGVRAGGDRAHPAHRARRSVPSGTGAVVAGAAGRPPALAGRPRRRGGPAAARPDRDRHRPAPAVADRRPAPGPGAALPVLRDLRGHRDAGVLGGVGGRPPRRLRDGSGEGLTLALMAGWVGIATGLSLSPWPAAAGGRGHVPRRRRMIGGLLGALAGGPVGRARRPGRARADRGEGLRSRLRRRRGGGRGLVFGAVIGLTAAGRRGAERMTVSEAVRAEPVTLLGFGLCGALTGLPPLRLAHAGPLPLAGGDHGRLRRWPSRSGSSSRSPRAAGARTRSWPTRARPSTATR